MKVNREKELVWFATLFLTYNLTLGTYDYYYNIGIIPLTILTFLGIVLFLILVIKRGYFKDAYIKGEVVS